MNSYGDNVKVIYFAGGYGLLVSILRDVGVYAYWSDPFTSNFVAFLLRSS